MGIFRPLLSFLFLAAASPMAMAQEPDPFSDPFGLPGATISPNGEAALVSEAKTIAPGKPFTVAFQVTPPDGWHTYYKNTGGIELPPSITWKLPEGFTAGPIQWPVPEVMDGALKNKSFYYHSKESFLVEITPPATLTAGTSTELTATAEWQVCSDTGCNNGRETFTLSLPVAASAETDTSKTELFSSARAKLAKSDSTWTITAESGGPDVRLRIKAGGSVPDLSTTKLDFIPDYPFVSSLSLGGSVTKDGDNWLVSLPRVKESITGSKIEQGKTISGIFLLGQAGSPDQRAIRVADLAIGKAPAVPLSFSAYLPVVGGMLLGGLILNLMPCVFPVLGLKIMGFVQQSGQDRKKIAAHGFAFTLGVLISFWIVSGLLFFLRENSTAEIGWGYQLQNKWFVYGLVMLFFVFGLSMFGLFEIGVSATSVGGKLQAKSGLAGSFFSGVLATVAATPCSAPILGPAIGAAIALPTGQFFIAFTAMALGLSLPYLIFSLFPKLVNMLPRPGAWMESFKQAMAFLLLGAAAYFLWVYLDHVAPDVTYVVFFGMVLIATAAWIYGRWASPYKKPVTKNVGRVAALIFAASGLYLATGPYKGLDWQPWSQGKVDTYLSDDTPVFVDFTAKWCATCQVNKKVAYTPEVVALFKERGIIPLRADKTKPDPDIDAKVEEFRKAAIPVNVLYVPGKEPIVTPEVLTPGYMKELIEKEVPKRAGT